jgi:hypothetical protein
MSCNTLENQAKFASYDKNGPTGKSTGGSYADLDVAFTQSDAMTEFENRLVRNNPLSSVCSSDNKSPRLSPKSEEKINRNVDRLLSQTAPVPPLNVNFPLDRNQRLPANQLGSNLLEGYEQTSNNNFWRNVGIVILVVIIVYALYRLITGDGDKSSVATPASTITINSATPTGSFYRGFY